MLHPGFDKQFETALADPSLTESERVAQMAQLRRHLTSLAEILASFYDDLDDFAERLGGYSAKLAALDDDHADHGHDVEL